VALMGKFHVSMPDDLQSEVERRGPRSTIIARDLERYYALLRRGAKELDALSADDRLLIRDAAISTAFEPWSILHIGAAVADAYPDATALHATIAGLSDVAKYALVDWLEVARHADNS
jgi:hypothetical protein